MKEEDLVNHPKHYNMGKYECIDIIEDILTPEQFEGYLLGNSIKYLYRRNHKGAKVQDTQKALWYLERLDKNDYKCEEDN